MKICIITKKEKYGVKEVISYTEKFTKDLDIFYGDIKSPISKDIFNEDYDILISYISPWIIPNQILMKTKRWNLNFHPGPPEYPGIGCFNFAIYDCANEFGSTAHIMEPKVDSGKIIGVERFKMNHNETVESLSIKTYKSQLNLYKSIISYIFKNDELPESLEMWKRKPYKRTELEKLATIEKHFDQIEIEKRIRATYYKGKPSPFIEIFGYKFEYNPDR